MDRSLVCAVNLVCATWTLNLILGHADALNAIIVYQGNRLVGNSMFQVKDEVRADTITPFLLDVLAGNILVFENDAGDMN
jgi:hypothetical protein